MPVIYFCSFNTKKVVTMFTTEETDYKKLIMNSYPKLNMYGNVYERLVYFFLTCLANSRTNIAYVCKYIHIMKDKIFRDVTCMMGFNINDAKSHSTETGHTHNEK